MTTILVTGATGTVGSTLIPLLRARGTDVQALVRDPDRAQRISAAGTQIVQGDLAILPPCGRRSTRSSWPAGTSPRRSSTNAT
jgi:nucleoside-diphosphate-sugar epimerase